MLTSERAPLLDEAQTDKNGANKWYRFIKYSSILLILIICGVVFYQMYNANPAQSMPQNSALMQENEIDDRELVTIEYDMDELPPSISTADITSLHDNDEMKQFHQELISKSGYNTDDYKIQFFVMDKEEEAEADDIEADTITSALKCGTMYTDSNAQSGSYALQLKCRARRSGDSAFKITGCVAYDPDNGGKRWGESGDYNIDCYTRQLNDQSTQLSGRCCKIESTTSASISTNYHYYNSVSNQECVKSICPSGQIAVGCTSTVSDRSSEHTAAFSGVERVIRPNQDRSGCFAQRGDPGYLWAVPYCATVTNANLKCKMVEGTAFAGQTIAHSRCEVKKGFQLTDCNGIIKDEMDQCTAGSIMDYGISYGANIVYGRCVAFGSSDAIVAQATCCKVAP